MTSRKWGREGGTKMAIWGDFQGLTGVIGGGRGVKKLENWVDVIYGYLYLDKINLPGVFEKGKHIALFSHSTNYNKRAESKILYSCSMIKFCEHLPNLLKIAFAFSLASIIIYYHGWEIQMRIVASLSDSSRDMFDSTTKLPNIINRTKVQLGQIKFLAHKKFKDRRKLIQNYCDKNAQEKELQEVNNDNKWNKDLWFDYRNKLLFCQISKISSNTWISNLML